MKVRKSTSRKHFLSSDVNKRRRRSKLDTKTQRRDAISTLRVSLPIPPKNNSRLTSRSMVKSRALSLITKTAKLSMPSSATNHQTLLQLPSKLVNNKPLMANTSSSTSTNLRKSERSNKKLLVIFLTSKTSENNNPPLLTSNGSTDQRFSKCSNI